MARKPLPNPDTLRQLIRYDRETGKLFWLRRPIDGLTSYKKSNTILWNARYADREALTAIGRKGHLNGTIMSVGVRAHHVVWCLEYGYWPEQIDHDDRNPANNQLANLKEVTTRQNCKNRRFPINNKSGHVGIRPSKSGKRWIALIGNNRDSKMHIGTFDTIELAIAARRAREIELNYHPNHGRKSAWAMLVKSKTNLN
jgi:hypothetical protein